MELDKQFDANDDVGTVMMKLVGLADANIIGRQLC